MMKVLSSSSSLLLLLAAAAFAPPGAVLAYDYELTSAGSVKLTDIKTEISDLKSIFIGDETSVAASEIEWEHIDNSTAYGPDSVVSYETYVDGDLSASGEHDLSGLPIPPTELDCGVIKVDKRKFSSLVGCVGLSLCPCSLHFRLC